MSSSYDDVIKTLDELKKTITKSVETIENNIIPKINNFEKVFVLNNYVPHVSLEDIDNFCVESCVMKDYVEPIFEYNPNTREKNIKIITPSNENNSVIIDSNNAKNSLKINEVNGLILYFDESYKNLIKKFNYYIDLIDYYGNGKRWCYKSHKCIEARIYTNYNFIIDVIFPNARIYQNYGLLKNPLLFYYYKEGCISGIEIKSFDFAYIKFTNIDNGEFLEFSETQQASPNSREIAIKLKIDEVKLNLFLLNCKKDYHPKIFLDYLTFKPIDDIRQFFNQIDNYTRFSNESIIKNIREEEVKNGNDKFNSKIKNYLEQIDYLTEQNKNYVEEMNTVKKENKVLTKKYENLEKLYNSLLEQE